MEGSTIYLCGKNTKTGKKLRSLDHKVKAAQTDAAATARFLGFEEFYTDPKFYRSGVVGFSKPTNAGKQIGFRLVEEGKYIPDLRTKVGKGAKSFMSKVKTIDIESSFSYVGMDPIKNTGLNFAITKAGYIFEVPKGHDYEPPKDCKVIEDE